MTKNAEKKEAFNPSRFDVLVALITKSNPDFAKASLDTDARIECKVLDSNIESNMEKKGKNVFLHQLMKVRVLSKGTKASLILHLGVRIELCVTSDQEIGWSNYQFNQDKFPHMVKSSNCDDVSDDDLIEYFFNCVSGMQFYPFDLEIKALMDYIEENQEQVKEAYDKITYVAPTPAEEEKDQYVVGDSGEEVAASEPNELIDLIG